MAGATSSPSPPALSVIIPTRDTRELLLRCVDSVRRQAPEAEVLVVDDGSVDGTATALATAHPDVVLLLNSQSQGYTRAANAGLGRARGEVLLLLNSDTEAAPGALAALAETLRRSPRLGVAGAKLLYPDGRPQWSGGPEPGRLWLFALGSGWGEATARWRGLLRRLRRRRRGMDSHHASGIEAVQWVSGAAMAVRRSTYEQLGALDERFAFYAQDLDYCRRAAAAGWQIGIVTAFTVFHVHGATIAGARRQRLDLLWMDLVRWAAKARGAAGADAARRALLWGSWLRLVGAGSRPADREAVRRARSALRAGLD